MSFFDYNEREYRKNTEIFKDQLREIHSNMQLRKIYNPEFGRAIVSIIDVLDEIPYSKSGDSKGKRAVDDYIRSLVQKIGLSVQQKNFAKAVLQAKMLNDIVNDSRSMGSFARSMEDLKATETLNDCLGELNQTGEQKENIKQRMNDILRECNRLNEMGLNNKITPLKNEHMQLESNLDAIERKENELTKTYQFNCEAIANTGDREFYRNLGRGDFLAMRPDNLGKVLNEISANIERNNTNVIMGTDILDQFKKDYSANAGTVTSNSTFEKNLEQMKAGDAMRDINSANYTPHQTQNSEVDSFEAKFKKFNG